MKSLSLVTAKAAEELLREEFNKMRTELDQELNIAASSSSITNKKSKKAKKTNHYS